MFIKSSNQSHGWVNPKTVEELWRDHFDYFYREYDDFVFPVTVHPDVAGHPHVIFMLERYVFSPFPSRPFSLLSIPPAHPPHLLTHLLCAPLPLISSQVRACSAELVADLSGREIDSSNTSARKRGWSG